MDHRTRSQPADSSAKSRLCPQFVMAATPRIAGKKYSSPTAFSVAAKRQAASGRQGNDGWRSTLYESAPLENYRRKYAAQFAAPLEDEEVRAQDAQGRAVEMRIGGGAVGGDVCDAERPCGRSVGVALLQPVGLRGSLRWARTAVGHSDNRSPHGPTAGRRCCDVVMPRVLSCPSAPRAARRVSTGRHQMRRLCSRVCDGVRTRCSALLHTVCCDRTQDLLFHDGAAEGDAAATGGAAEGTQPATDQWVQCDRCSFSMGRMLERPAGLDSVCVSGSKGQPHDGTVP